MPPRRNRPLTEAYEQEFEQRIMERIEERLGQFVDQLTDQMNDLMNNRRPCNYHREDEDEESEENPFGDGSSSDEQSVLRPRRNQKEDNRRWESEVFEFKEVPENKRVSLIATKLRGRASAWWQQMKLTNERVGKSKIMSWQKMKKCMRANFIPHNYQRLMYQRLQNLKQGSKSVEDYTTEFYHLIVRNDIQEREDQLVSRYIGVSGSGNAVSRFAPNQAKAGGGNTGPVPKATGSSELKCFNCGEPGHRQSKCKKAGKRHLFVDPEDNDDDVSYGDYEAAPVYDEEPEYEEEYVSGDVGVNLVFEDELEIMEKMNSNAYRLKLPSHIRCSDVFNVKHLLPYHGNSFDEVSVGNSRTNFVYPGGNDVKPSIEERADLFLEA
uniref:CCHC-type domain-containing protein n=1 Tax=Tanacetum cinerariifolium TaxID=118510 RepID=A0A699GYW0_TANCI|nr:hypothetical protein [Tanacetum cinerariifolium]